MTFLLFRGGLCSRCARRWASATLRSASTTSDAPPPLLTKIRNDLKNAMRAKDTARLNVLRSIITETGNASKGTNPVTSDMQVLAMLRKRKAASKSAADEAREAKRDDLAQKQEAELSILDEYASQVNVMSEDATRQVVQPVVETLKTEGQTLNAGSVMKQLFKAGGALEGKPVDKAQVATVVKELLSKV